MWNKLRNGFFSENASFALAITGFLVLGGTIILFLANFGGFTTAIDSDKLDHFGSFIGGLVGAIWSLASFILLYISLKTQKAEKFETTFFNLLNLYQSQISKNIDKERTTRSILQIVGQELVDYSNNYDCLRLNDEKLLEFSLKEDKKELFNIHLLKINEYFKTIEYIIDFVLKSKAKDKQNYLDILYFHFSIEEKKCIEFFTNENKEFKNIIINANQIVDFFEL